MNQHNEVRCGGSGGVPSAAKIRPSTVPCPGCPDCKPDQDKGGREVERRRRIGDAEELLGEYGAGGSPAGLIGGIHNLAHRAEKAEDRERVLEEAIRAFLDLQGRSLPVETGAYEEANAIRGLRKALQAALDKAAPDGGAVLAEHDVEDGRADRGR